MGLGVFRNERLTAPQRPPKFRQLCVIPLMVFTALPGCGAPQSVVFDEDTSRQNLQRIGVAYAQVSAALNRPPRNQQELISAIQGDSSQPSAAQILRSPNDGEDYVVVWDVDFRQLARERGNVDVVLAYEKRGRAGRRYVMKPPNHVVIMTDEEFKAAAFPPGHTPGS